MKQFIARFSAPPADESMASAPVALGNAPPCELYAKLRPVTDVQELVQKFHTATLPKHIKDSASALDEVDSSCPWCGFDLGW